MVPFGQSRKDGPPTEQHSHRPRVSAGAADLRQSRSPVFRPRTTSPAEFDNLAPKARDTRLEYARSLGFPAQAFADYTWPEIRGQTSKSPKFDKCLQSNLGDLDV